MFESKLIDIFILVLIWMRTYLGIPTSGGLGAIRCVRNLVPSETLVMDENLSWDSHIRRPRGSLKLSSPNLTLITVALYGAAAGVCHSERFQKLPNRAARLITFSVLDVRSSTLLSDLGWDSLSQSEGVATSNHFV